MLLPEAISTYSTSCSGPGLMGVLDGEAASTELCARSTRSSDSGVVFGRPEGEGCKVARRDIAGSGGDQAIGGDGEGEAKRGVVTLLVGTKP
eukprot:g8215.t1